MDEVVVEEENVPDEEEEDSPQLPRARETTRRNTMGKFRLLSDLEPIEVTFILLAFVSIVGACIVTIVRVYDSQSSEADFTFGILLLINLAFVLYYTIHGVFCERAFELLMSVAATTIVLSYCIIEYATHGHKDVEAERDLKMGRLIVVCVLGPVDIVLGLIIARKIFISKKLIFRTVGGNAALQDMCQVMFCFTAFLKFDFQLVVSLLVLVLNGGFTHITLAQQLVLGVGVPVSFSWLVVGFLMIRYENYKLSMTFWMIGLMLPVYVVFLLIRAERHEETSVYLYPTTIATGVIGLIIRIVAGGLSYLVVQNFNKGLKEKVYGGRMDQPSTGRGRRGRGGGGGRGVQDQQVVEEE